MKTKPFVYVASPYTRGDCCINTRCQMELFDKMLTDRLVTPYVPLWSHFQHTAFPRPYQDWINYDIEILETGGFDACLRVPAINHALGYREEQSSGADGEVQWFLDRGLPVFYDLNSLYEAVRAGEVDIRTRDYSENQP